MLVNEQCLRENISAHTKKPEKTHEIVEMRAVKNFFEKTDHHRHIISQQLAALRRGIIIYKTPGMLLFLAAVNYNLLTTVILN